MTDEDKAFDKWVDNVILTYEKKIQEVCSGKDDDRRDRCLSGEATKVRALIADTQRDG